METRINLWLDNNEKNRIEQRIKAEYPKIKTVSALVRAAINEFLAKDNQSIRLEADASGE